MFPLEGTSTDRYVYSIAYVFGWVSGPYKNDTDDVVIGRTLRELCWPGCIPWSCLPELRSGDVNGGSIGPAG